MMPPAAALQPAPWRFTRARVGHGVFVHLPALQSSPNPKYPVHPSPNSPPVGQTRQEPRPFQTAPKPMALGLRLSSLSLVEKGGLEVPGFRMYSLRIWCLGILSV